MPSTIEVASFPSIYPPRPGGSIRPATVTRYRGYVAQYKYDDVRVLVLFHPDGRIELLSRRREPIRSYALGERARAALRGLRLAPGRRHLLDGGLMRQAAPRLRIRPIVLWDILIEDDEYLLGTSYARRYARLRRACGDPHEPERDSGQGLALGVAPGLWLAPTFRGGFDREFTRALGSDQLEGLMLKNPRGRLDWGVTEENNGEWQIRVRKASGRHVF